VIEFLISQVRSRDWRIHASKSTQDMCYIIQEWVRESNQVVVIVVVRIPWRDTWEGDGWPAGVSMVSQEIKRNRGSEWLLSNSRGRDSRQMAREKGGIVLQTHSRESNKKNKVRDFILSNCPSKESNWNGHLMHARERQWTDWPSTPSIYIKCICLLWSGRRYTHSRHHKRARNRTSWSFQRRKRIYPSEWSGSQENAREQEDIIMSSFYDLLQDSCESSRVLPRVLSEENQNQGSRLRVSP